MAVEVAQLGEIETRRRAADAVQVEPPDRLLDVDDFVIPVAPAQAQEIVAQRLGKIAHFPVRFHRQGPVPFRQLGPVGPVN